MKNCELYYNVVQRYRKGLGEINGKFDKQIEGKESYRGSAGYQADIEKIERCGPTVGRASTSASKAWSSTQKSGP